MFTSLSQIKVIGNRVARNFAPWASQAAGKSLTFLKTSLVDGSRSLIRGEYSHRQAAIVIASTLPAIIAALVVTLPGILFPTEAHQAFHYFAQSLETEKVSMLPTFLGLASSILGLRVPVGL